MRSHPNVINIQAFDITASEEGTSLYHLRLISDYVSYTVMEYLKVKPWADRMKLVSICFLQYLAFV